MFVLSGKEARAEIRDQSEIDNVIRKLEGAEVKPLVRAMLHAACGAAGIPRYHLNVNDLLSGRLQYRHPSQLGPLGDVLCYTDRLFLLNPHGKRLMAWEVRHHTSESRLPEFCDSVENAIKLQLDGRRVRGMSFEWKDARTRMTIRRVGLRRPYFQEEPLRTKEASYSEEELKQAKVITSEKHRIFLLGLAQIGKARSVDAASVANEGVVHPLLEAELIQKEYLVSCKKDSRTLCTISQQSELETPVGSDMRCPVCSRSFKDELIQEIYSLTEIARDLLRSSKWMTVWVTDLIVNSGIPIDQIGWNAEAGDDELDIVATLLNQRIFFELKDREFGLGDAYPFGFRVERYRGDLGVVLTTDKVAEDAKRFFKEEVANRRGVRITFVEGVGGIEERMEELVNDIAKSAIYQFFGEFSERFGIDLVAFVKAWMENSAVRKVAVSIVP